MNCDDLEGVQVTVFILNGDIFAGVECMRSKAITRFVVFIPLNVIVKGPRTARTVDQVADFLFLIARKPANASMIPLFLQGCSINVTCLIQRCCKLIAMLGRALRVLLGAGKVQADFLEGMKFTHDQSPSSIWLHSGTDRKTLIERNQ